MRGQFLPQDRDLRQALLELTEADPRPPVIFRIVCHDQVIANAYDLGSGRSFIVSKIDVPRATIRGGPLDGSVSDRRWQGTSAAFIEDQPVDLTTYNLDTYREVFGPDALPPPKTYPMVPKHCPRGHDVLVGRGQLQRAVEEYRSGRRAPGRKLILTIEHTADDAMLGVLT
jgi:hypothetical protein